MPFPSSTLLSGPVTLSLSLTHTHTHTHTIFQFQSPPPILSPHQIKGHVYSQATFRKTDILALLPKLPLLHKEHIVFAKPGETEYLSRVSPHYMVTVNMDSQQAALQVPGELKSQPLPLWLDTAH